jgi:hypothetical protein
MQKDSDSRMIITPPRLNVQPARRLGIFVAIGLLSRLSSRCPHSRPLVMPPSRLLASPLIVLSLHRPLIVSLRRLVVVVSPLGAPPSRPLVVLSLRRPLAVSSRRLVVASPLVALSSRPLLVLSLRHPLVV